MWTRRLSETPFFAKAKNILRAQKCCHEGSPDRVRALIIIAYFSLRITGLLSRVIGDGRGRTPEAKNHQIVSLRSSQNLRAWKTQCLFFAMLWYTAILNQSWKHQLASEVQRSRYVWTFFWSVDIRPVSVTVFVAPQRTKLRRKG